MSKQLREARAQAHNEGLRALAANNRPAFDLAMKQVDKLAVEIEASEKRSGQPVEQRFEVSDANHARTFAFGKWLRGGDGAVDNTEKRSIEFRDVSEGN